MIVLLEKFKTKINFKEFLLILPSVSVGNVGQLTVDLLISTLELKKIGYVRHRNIQPVVAHSNKSVATECEIFASTDLKLMVLQIRSSYGPFKSISSFMSELAKSVKGVIILTGSYAYERKDIHLVSDPIKYLSTFGDEKKFIESIPEKWQKIEVSRQSNLRVCIPGSGIADHLYHMCSLANIPAVIIVNYLSEGDNRRDAIALANFVDMWLLLRNKIGKSEETWCVPSVWSSLFGNEFPKEIF